MTYTAGEWHQENPGWVFEPASIASIDHEKSELTLMAAKLKAPTAQAVIEAYQELYRHHACLYLSTDCVGTLRGQIAWRDVCLEPCGSPEILLESEGKTLDAVLLDLASQLRANAMTSGDDRRYISVTKLLATE